MPETMPPPPVPQPEVDGKPPVAPEGSDSPTVDELHGADLVHPTFWQTEMAQKVLPFATSLGLHIGLALLIWGTYKVGSQIVQVVKNQIIVPDSAIVDGGKVGGIPNPGLGDDPNREAMQNEIQDVQNPTGISNKDSTTLLANIGGGQGDESLTSSVIGSGGGAKGKGGGIGIGTGTGTGSGGDGGGLAPFGPPGGGTGGAGPRSSFVGTSGNANKIVYLCDATGTMMNAFDSMRLQLRTSISALKPSQFFNVIFFRDEEVVPFDKTRLVMATPDSLKRVSDFLENQTAHGMTDPLPAIRAAFALNPQLIYVLTDGFDQVSSYDVVVEEFRKLNPDKKVKVNTILLQTSSDPELVKVLKQIADENHGQFVVKKSLDDPG